MAARASDREFLFVFEESFADNTIGTFLEQQFLSDKLSNLQRAIFIAPMLELLGNEQIQMGQPH